MDNAKHQDRHDAESYRRVEVITGRRRRTFRSAAEKAAIVAESFEVGANVSDVARRHGVNRGLLFTWRRQAMAGAYQRGRSRPSLEQPSSAALAAFVPVELAADGSTADAAHGEATATGIGAIEIVMATATVRVPSGVDAATLATVLGAIRAAS